MKLLISILIAFLLIIGTINAFELPIESKATVNGISEPEPQPGDSQGGSGGGGGGGRGSRRIESQQNQSIPEIINDSVKLDFRVKDNFEIKPKERLNIILVFNNSTSKYSKIIALDNNYVGYFVEDLGVYRIGSEPILINISNFNLNLSYNDFLNFNLIKVKLVGPEKPVIPEVYQYDTFSFFIILVLILLLFIYIIHEAKKRKFLK